MPYGMRKLAERHARSKHGLVGTHLGGPNVKYGIVSLVSVLALGWALESSGPARADEHSFGERLEEIRKFATDLCETAPIWSSAEKSALTAEGEAQLKAFLGIELGAAFSSEEETTFGVLREDLPSLIEQSVTCRQSVFERLAQYLESHNRSGNRPARWAPIFYSGEVALLPSCRDKSVACELPHRNDYALLGYTQENVFDGGSLIPFTYPGNLVRVTRNLQSTDLHVEYLSLNDPFVRIAMQDLGVDISAIADLGVCHCRN